MRDRKISREKRGNTRRYIPGRSLSDVFLDPGLRRDDEEERRDDEEERRDDEEERRDDEEGGWDFFLE